MLVAKKEVESTHPQILQLLNKVRSKRAFNAQDCLDKKVKLINSYFSENQLSAAVLGLSGGVDSAVTLGLLTQAGRQKDSVIKKILTTAIPFSVDQGATNQEIAKNRAQIVAKKFGAEFISLDLGDSFRALRNVVNSELDLPADAWADGQLVAYMRTPALYYLSAVLSSNRQAAIVCGTTNRDEGGYLGFFGKASDGMVDLQILSDLHKSEVYQLARLLDVPESTLSAEPTGDVFDGKSHLEMIGAPYDFVELYTHWLNASRSERKEWFQSCNAEAQDQFLVWAGRIEEMHNYNAHKYMGGNPSVHLDIYPRAVTGGWIKQGSYKTSERKFVAEFKLDILSLFKLDSAQPTTINKIELPELADKAFVLNGVLSETESEILLVQQQKQKRLAVGRNGILKDYKLGDPIGSFRSTAYSPELAEIVWDRIKNFIPAERNFDSSATTDWCQHPKWMPIGINPAFRFISYEKGGDLIVHYDAGYKPEDDKTHTLMSVVIYLTGADSNFGGATRFIKDPQANLPYNQRDFSDWQREARSDEVLTVVKPETGKLLIFDHRLLHDAELWSGPSEKVILRTDIVFEKVF